MNPVSQFPISVSQKLQFMEPTFRKMREILEKANEQIRAVETALKDGCLSTEVIVSPKACRSVGTDESGRKYASFLGWLRDDSNKFRLMYITGRIDAKTLSEWCLMSANIDEIEIESMKPLIECEAYIRRTKVKYLPEFLDEVKEALDADINYFS